MPFNHLIVHHPFFLLPSIFPSIRVFSNESALHIRWPKCWSFSFSISPSNEYSGLISFRMDWLDLLAAQGTLKSLLQHHSSKVSSLWRSAFFAAQLSHPHMIPVCQLNTGALHQERQMTRTLKGDIDSGTIVVGTLPRCFHRRKDNQTENLQNTAFKDPLDHVDLTDLYTAFHSKASEYTFFSGLQGTLSRIYHMLGDKMGLGKCKKTDITPSIFLITLRH